LWRFVDELFEADGVEALLVASGVAVDPASLREPWTATVTSAFAEATLVVPTRTVGLSGGRTGRHGEALSYLLGELQVVARAHPGARW
jgi:ring-1,2-phenylacetyl-CoA epoxidase subunit PaaC